MPKCYINLIAEIDPTADPERVGDIADARGHRYFSKMTRAEWAQCVTESKGL